MSGVSPTDNSYSQYQRSLGELEDDLQSEYKERESKRNEQMLELEDRYEKKLRASEEDNIDVVNDVKKKYEDTLSDNKKSHLEEHKKMKKELHDTYDRFGRTAREADQYVNKMGKEYEIAKQREVDSRTQGEAYYEKKLNNKDVKHNDQMETVVKGLKEDSETELTRMKREQQFLMGETRKDYDKRVEKINSEAMSERQFEKNYTANELERAKQHSHARVTSTQKQADEAIAKISHAFNEKSEQNLTAIQQSNKKEMEDVSARLAEAVGAQRSIAKERAKAREETIKKTENEYLATMKSNDDSRQREINRLKENIGDQDRYFNQLNNQNIRDRDAHYAKMINKRDGDHYHEQKELTDNFNRASKELNDITSNKLKRSDLAHEYQMDQASQQREASLQKQATTAGDALNEQKRNYSDQVRMLENQLQNKKTTNDVGAISPQAEEALRGQLSSKFGDQFDAERSRNLAETDNLKRAYQDKYLEQYNKNMDTTTTIARESQGKIDMDRKYYQDLIDDTERNHFETTRSNKQSQEREVEKMQRLHSRELETQRRHYDELIAEIKQTHEQRNRTATQDAEFTIKSQQRDFAMRMNGTVRDYEKRLQEQKEESDFQKELMREDQNKALRDKDKMTLNELENQAQTYEHKIKQMEKQYEQREALFRENYEDQLAKARKTNEYLVKKKS